MNINFRPAFAEGELDVVLTDDIGSIEAEWRTLCRFVPCTPFHSFEVMRLFLGTAARNAATPLVAVVRLADSLRTVAIFPMTRARKGLFEALTVADHGIIDYAVPLLDTRIVNAANIDSMMSALTRAVPADYLYVNRIPQTIAGKVNPMAASANCARLTFSAWPLRLEGAYAGRAVSRQSPKFRRELARCIRKMEREHERKFEMFVGPAVTDEHFHLLQRMRREWFQSKDRHDVVNDPAWVDFYRGLARGEGGDTQPWIATLSADGEVVAIDFGLIRDRHAIVMLGAARGEEWSRFSPGIQLTEEEIRWFEANGAAEYDISVGDSSSKRKFAPAVNALYDAVFPGTAMGHAYLAFWRTKTRIRESETLVSVLRRMWTHKVKLALFAAGMGALSLDLV